MRGSLLWIFAASDSDSKVYEPVPRMCSGKFGYVRHTFPIKGGLSAFQVWNLSISEEFTKANPLPWKLNANGTLEKK